MSLIRSAVALCVVLLVPTLAAASPVLLGVTPTSWQIGNATDGTSNTIVFGTTTSLDVCVPTVAIPGGLSDGTSNTIQFTETLGLLVTWSSRATTIDGTSNTIVLGESCFRGIAAPQPIGPITDGTSNTISFGEFTIDLRNRSFDVCFSDASRIADGTSNTIQLGEVLTRQCFLDMTIAPGLGASVPAPTALPLLGLGLAAGWLAGWRRRG